VNILILTLFSLPFLAFIIDLLLGDPQRLPHPVRLIGLWLDQLERLVRRLGLPLRLAGGLCVLVTAGLAYVSVDFLCGFKYFGMILLVYFAYAGLALGELLDSARDALELIEDNYRVSEMREILSAELHQAAARGEARERVFRSMAAYAPAYGVAGSVTGLIALLLGLGDTAVILKSIPVALVSTLYGVVAANFFFMPAAEKVRQATEQELVIHALILEGTLALSRKPNARRLARRLNSLVDPAERMSEEAALKAARSLKLGPLELAEDVPAEPAQSLG